MRRTLPEKQQSKTSVTLNPIWIIWLMAFRKRFRRIAVGVVEL